MEKFVERMEAERVELETRFKKLVEFINSDKFNQLPFVKCDLLKNQAEFMANYLRVLTMRLELEKNERLVDWKPEPPKSEEK